MAKNLQAKLTPADKVCLFDINKDAVASLQAEMKASGTGASVCVATSALGASKDAVRALHTLLTPRLR